MDKKTRGDSRRSKDEEAGREMETERSYFDFQSPAEGAGRKSNNQIYETREI